MSSWVQFGPGTNFVVDTTRPIPTGLTQLEADDATVIATGGTTTETVVTLQARSVDPNGGMVVLQVEVQPQGTAFTGVFTAQSDAMASGSTVPVAVTGLAVGNYHWQARTKFEDGTCSPYAQHGGSPDFSVASSVNAAPAAPTTVTQNMSDSMTALPNGATTAEGTVCFMGTVTDSEGDPCRFEIELVTPDTNPFTNVPTHVSEFMPSGGMPMILRTGLANGTYKWQYRSQDSHGNVSAWTPFNASTPNVTIAMSAGTPGVPTSPGQAAGGSPLAAGGSTSSDTVTFSATLSDPDGDGVFLEVEVRPTGTAFTNAPSAQSPFVTVGSNATVSVGGLSGGYHWQYRATDATGLSSAWTAFGGPADFTASVAPAATSASHHHCGTGAKGSGEPTILLGIGVLLLLARRLRSA